MMTGGNQGKQNKKQTNKNKTGKKIIIENYHPVLSSQLQCEKMKNSQKQWFNSLTDAFLDRSDRTTNVSARLRRKINTVVKMLQFRQH